MGGMHVTSDDLFISMEMNVRNEERAKVEKERKKRLQLHYSSKVSQLTHSVLLISTCGSRGIRRQRQRVQKSWTNYNSGWRSGRMAIHHLRTRDGRMRRSRGLLLFMQPNIDISDTQYGGEVALKKRELEAAADHFNREERTEL